ncbi:Leu/Phe/Val dehydrogenase [Alkalimarinus coralli]|uniref:Leu/Phe/Val dehydrogenase n=1 Tax=Alkalimarinus coralli TaxID=2935863 RepID=UPI00202AF7C9|nr:amino acid dehydrogenase [Alkalimarinus coralli]
MFQRLKANKAHDLHFKYDPDSGLKAIIAIHDTRKGPALGGCRFLHYNAADDAINDALRLARGMSYKAVMANLPQGGGKSVIMKPNGHFNRQELFTAFGRFVEELNGRYITAIDSGTSAVEMDIINQQTSHVTSTSHEDNPSIYTSQGVFEGIKAAVKSTFKQSNLKGITVAVQGLGNVGYPLIQSLHHAGAKLVVTDINADRLQQVAKEFNATAVAPDEIYAAECDVFSPCGLGAIVNHHTIPQFKCKVIAGSANNQLATEEDGLRLFEKGILYAPDYVINGGGLIYASMNHIHQPAADIAKKTSEIAATLSEIFAESSAQNRPSSEVADHIAQQRLYRE